VRATGLFHAVHYPRNGRYCAVQVITERANGVVADSWLRDCRRGCGTHHFGWRCGSVGPPTRPGPAAPLDRARRGHRSDARTGSTRSARLFRSGGVRHSRGRRMGWSRPVEPRSRRSPRGAALDRFRPPPL